MNTERLRVPAPAKLNLRLKVEGKREDGYHLLRMLNVTISLLDSVEMIVFHHSTEISLTIENSEAENVPHGVDENLASRAAATFFRHFDLAYGVDIRLSKRIPAGGGLGGGSSDAAAVLRGLRHLFGPRLRERYGLDDTQTDTILNQLATSLGADVPYLLSGRPSIVSGIGEEIVPLSLPWLIGAPCIVIFPPYRTNTGQIFRSYRGPYEVDGFLRDPTIPDSPSDAFLQSLVENDLQAVVFTHHPELSDLLNDVKSALPDIHWGMSGSGSTLFGISSSGSPSDKRLETLDPVLHTHKARAVLTSVLSRSPDVISAGGDL